MANAVVLEQAEIAFMHPDDVVQILEENSGNFALLSASGIGIHPTFSFGQIAQPAAVPFSFEGTTYPFSDAVGINTAHRYLKCAVNEVGAPLTPQRMDGPIPVLVNCPETDYNSKLALGNSVESISARIKLPLIVEAFLRRYELKAIHGHFT